MAASTTIRLKDATEVTAWIATKVAETIAKAGREGHDLDTVLFRMTSTKVLATIRVAYIHQVENGVDKPEAIKKIGVRLIAEYRKTYDLN